MTFAFLFYFKDFPLTFLSIFSEYLFFFQNVLCLCLLLLLSQVFMYTRLASNPILSRMSFNLLSLCRDCMCAGSPPQPVCMQFSGPNTASRLLCKHHTNSTTLPVPQKVLSWGIGSCWIIFSVSNKSLEINFAPVLGLFHSFTNFSIKRSKRYGRNQEVRKAQGTIYSKSKRICRC